MIQINAVARLAAMPIRDGDNFDSAKDMLKKVGAHKASEYQQLGTAGAYTVLRRVQGNSQWYVLVDAYVASDKPLKSASKICGFMAVLRFPNVDEVFSVYVNPKMRGKGLGQTLYSVAHKEAKKGLQSSDDLGTLSLATWLSIYKKELKVVLVMKGKKLKRQDVKVSGLNIEYKGQALTGEGTPVFNFFWK